MAALTAIYDPPSPGLPYHALLVLPSGEVNVEPFDRREDAVAYLDVCDAGLLADAKRQGKVN